MPERPGHGRAALRNIALKNPARNLGYLCSRHLFTGLCPSHIVRFRRRIQILDSETAPKRLHGSETRASDKANAHHATLVPLREPPLLKQSACGRFLVLLYWLSLPIIPRLPTHRTRQLPREVIIIIASIPSGEAHFQATCSAAFDISYVPVIGSSIRATKGLYGCMGFPRGGSTWTIMRYIRV